MGGRFRRTVAPEGIIRPGTRGEPAFSLIEMAMALGIVAFGLVGVISLYSSGFLGSRDAIERTAAAHLVADTLTGIELLTSGQSPASGPPAFAAESLAARIAGSIPPGWNGVTPISGTFFVAADGRVVASAQQAQFSVRYELAEIDPRLGGLRVYLNVGWPPASPATARTSVEHVALARRVK